MHDVAQIRLSHDRIDILVRQRRIVANSGIRAAFDPHRLALEIVWREPALRFLAAHAATGTMRAALEGVDVPLSSNDVRSRAHLARNDAELPDARAHRAFARHEYIRTKMVLT